MGNVKAFFLTAATLCKKPGETKDGKVTKAAELDHKQPGEVATISQEDYDHLLENGAIRKPTADELKLAEGREPAKTKKAASAEDISAAEQLVTAAQNKVDGATDDAAKTAAKAGLTAAQTALAKLKA